MKKILTFVALFIAINGGLMNAQSLLKIVQIEGEEHSVELSAIKSIAFIADIIVINLDSKMDYSIALPCASVRKLYFCEDTITNNVGINASNLKLYPNPVSDFLTIDGIDNECDIVIFSMNGIERLRRQYYRGIHIDVSDFVSGLYVIRIGDVYCKFIKK